MSLSINSQAPDFTLPSTSGSDFTLSKEAKGQSVILFFYPQDFTPGCTKEACSFRDNFDVFREVDIPVFGISTDSISSHQKFKKSHNLPFELLSDKTARVSRLYKAKMPILKKSKRITYLLNEDHKVAAVYDNLFGAENHIREMIKQLNKGKKNQK